MKFITDNYISPHKVESRNIEKKDINRVDKDGETLFKLCHEPMGRFNGALAVAHQQITKKDPLRFFVTTGGQIVINPVIKRHTRHTVDSREGCMSFPEKAEIIVQRYNKCEVEYYTLEEGKNGKPKLSGKIEEQLRGKLAKVFQHEIDHFDCKYIFKK